MIITAKTITIMAIVIMITTMMQIIAVFTLEDEELVKTGFSSDEFLVKGEFVTDFEKFPVNSGSFFFYFDE